MIKVVNVVGSGSLGVELDLERVTTDVGTIAEYDPEKYPGMYIRFDENTPLITVYRTGKYIITGGSSQEEVYATREHFLDLISSDRTILNPNNNSYFSIQNLVCTAELEKSLNLKALAIELGLENTEYEPEQFPGLVYRLSDTDAIALLFATGKVVITGSPDFDSAKKVLTTVKKEVAEEDYH